jgi:hypothetical protein
MRRRTKLSHLPLNALRAFEATARHLSFTRAGLELRVTQAAVSQHVKVLEDRLGVQLFRRLPRGVALTDEGQSLLPSIVEPLAGSPKRSTVLKMVIIKRSSRLAWSVPSLRDGCCRGSMLSGRPIRGSICGCSPTTIA